jgi:hypothetical protein
VVTYTTYTHRKEDHVFTATGTYEGVPFDVTIDDGVVSGSDRIADLLLSREGQEFSATPTSGARALVLDDDLSVLIALQNLTSLVGTSGDVPVEETDDDVPADAVFSTPTRG